MSSRDKDRSRDVEAIFTEALDLKPEERSAFLDRRCGQDSSLRREVEELLSHHASARQSFMEEAAFQQPPTDTEQLAANHGDDQRSVGPYRLVKKLGEGGMGEVYEARQEEPIKRRVALKLIKRGLETRALLARFEAERQALALMDHPCIARVYDAGETQDARPYFAMEYVQGIPITEHCDKHRLTTSERLELLAEVCEGVQHAHQKALIHRDLKPSNVLVAFQGDKSMPKIIDFGIARAMAQPLTDRTLVTELGQVMGTPEYMSPEQAEMSGQDIDTRTDVYALGVILYQLLTGVLPFDSRRLREAGLDEARRMIREVDPSRPSTRVTEVDEDSNARAMRRRSTPQHLAGELRGDLDWITLRALEKERTRRYSTPMDLAEDLRRYLRNEPVHAHPPSNAYRIQKLVKRNKLATALAATVTVLILGLAVTMTVLRSQAESARADAQARAEELELVTSFQSSMLSEIDAEAMGTALVGDLGERVRESLSEEGLSPQEVESSASIFEEALGRVNATDAALTLIDGQILERAVATIDEEFADQPEVQAALQHTVAVTYGALGRDATAVPLLEAALDTRRESLGDLHPATLASINSMCEVLRRMGEFDRALEYCREGLEGCEQALGDDHFATLQATNNLGYLLSDMGDDDEALVLYRKALEVSRRELGDDHPETVRSINNVGALLVTRGELDEALVYYRESLEGCRRIYGPDHPTTLGAISNMGGLYYNMGKPEEAARYLSEALEVRRRTLGRDHPETLASTQNMGILLQSMGRYDEAIVYQREAVADARRVLGDDHPSTLHMISGMAVSLREMGELEEALGHFRSTTTKLKSILGEDHPRTFSSISGMSRVLMAMGRFEEALVHSRELLEGRRRVLGDDNPRTLAAIGNMGRLLGKMGERDQALAYHREALEGFRRVLGDEHPSTLTAIYDQASLLLDLNEPEKSIELLQPAETVARGTFTGARADRMGIFLATLGSAQAATRAYEAGRTTLTEAYKILSEAPNAATEDIERVCVAMAGLHDAWHSAEPSAGHDRVASEWRQKLKELRVGGGEEG